MFEVKKHLIKVQGNRLYLPVAARLVWFRQEHPDWGIETQPIEINVEKHYAIFQAKVYNAEGKLMATGTKMEDIRGFSDWAEKAETGAIGRALAVCGFGTQFAPEFDEVASGRIVDSPQPTGRPAFPQPRNGAGNEGQSGNGNGNGNGRAPREYDGADLPAPRETNAAQPQRSTPAQQRPLSDDFVDAELNGDNGGRDEAPRPAARPQANPTPVAVGDTAQSGEHECAGCGRGLTKGQEALSVRKYGIALCPDCQKERRTAEAGV